MRYIICIYISLLAICISGCGPAQQKIPVRNYQAGEPIIEVASAVINANDQPWKQVSEGVRRKVYFNDRLTLVYLEIVGGDKRPMSPPHYHHHDQIGYVLEGKAIVYLGDHTKQINPGGAYIVTSNIPHALKPLTDKLVLIEMFTPTREDFRVK